MIKRLVGNGSFGADYSEQCPDGRGIVGTDEQQMALGAAAEVPDVAWPLDPTEVPVPAAIMDLLEFCYLHVAAPIQGGHHSFFDHHHLSFDQGRGQAEFRNEVNRLLARNRLAYQMDESGLAVRRGPPVLHEHLAAARFDTGDTELDAMLEAARTKFFDPDADVRRESLEKLWDAWERLKTLEPGADKKQSANRMLDMASPEPRFREKLGEEARQLTEIGNSFKIRHSETTQIPLSQDEHVDYLFHRLFAFIRLCLRMRSGGN